MSAKYIFVTGGVVSSLGKGSGSGFHRLPHGKPRPEGHSAEVRSLSQRRSRHHVAVPARRGLRHRRWRRNRPRPRPLRALHPRQAVSRENNWTTGRIYETIIAKERRGDYLGKTVQVIPHVTNEIKSAMKKVAQDVDLAIVEIGGTVGDIESLPFIEAIRQMRQELGRENTLFVHVTLVPYIAAAGELKTKPTQHSVKELLSIGIQPDILLVPHRPLPLAQISRSKIALFCNVENEAVITAKDVASIYEVPLVFAHEKVDELALRYLHIPKPRRPDLSRWEELVQRVYNPKDEVVIGIVGKYVEYEDSYKSLKEALVHGALAYNLKLHVNWIEAEGLESKEQSVQAQLGSTSTAFWCRAASASAASKAC